MKLRMLVAAVAILPAWAPAQDLLVRAKTVVIAPRSAIRISRAIQSSSVRNSRVASMIAAPPK